MIRCNLYITFLSLLTITSVSAQTDFAQEIQRKLSAYYDNEAGPKAYITFNQPEYHPGDTAFFKAFLLTSTGNAFTKGWQVIDIFITDENGAVVLRNRTSVKNGTGASQFAIPHNAKEGRYTLTVAQPDLSKVHKYPIAYRTSFIVSGKKLPKLSGAEPLAVYPEDSKTIQIAVASRKETNSLDVTLNNHTDGSSALHLVCISKNKLVDVFPVSFDNTGNATFTLSLNLLPAGVSRFSVLDDKGNVYADRLFYKYQSQIPVTDVKETYSTRSPVDFEIELPKELTSRSVNGSIAVYKKDLFPEQQQNTLLQRVVFADVKTEIPLPTSTAEQDINDLLIRATPAADWTNIWAASSEERKPIYSPFFKGKIILPNGAPVKDSTLITFWLKDQDFIYSIYSQAQGQFSFPLFSEFADDEILYTVTHKKSHVHGARVVLDNVTVPTLTNKSLTYSEKENPYAWFSSLRSAVQKSYGYFQRDNNGVIVRPYVESIPTDAVFPIEKFKDFASVAEMVNEVVPVVKAKKVGNHYELRVFIREFAMHAPANPLVMIDGFVTDSIEYLMNMSPNQIKSFGVVNSRNKLVRYGALGRNGIVTVETTRTEIQNLRSQNSVFVKGIDLPVDFNPSAVKPTKPRIPVLRSTLYWDPKVTLTKTSPYVGQLQTTDDVGEYVIVFTGLDEKGLPVEIIKTFVVNYTGE